MGAAKVTGGVIADLASSTGHDGLNQGEVPFGCLNDDHHAVVLEGFHWWIVVGRARRVGDLRAIF